MPTVEDDFADVSLRRQALSNDLHRPLYHFLPPDAWTNDPNGLIKWRGQYHLFYQHNPRAARWEAPHWGHAVSNDLVRWRDLPVAIAPEDEPRDEGGCYSGVVVDNGGTPTMIYTGVSDGEQRTCLALGDPTLTHWRKFEGNPVVRFPKTLEAGERFDAAFRDPFVWREGMVWFQLIGTSLFGRGQVLLYRSTDLVHWDYLHPFVPQDLRTTLDDIGKVWECPSFVKLGDKHVLVVSLYTGDLPYAIALVGTYRDLQFYPERAQRFDHGLDCLYAPAVLNDDGQYLTWGWLQEQRTSKAQMRAGWAGVMSLPRVLSLGPDNTLLTTFAPQLHALRAEKLFSGDLDVETPFDLPSVSGRHLEVSFRLERGWGSEAGLSLCRAPGGEEETLVYIDWETARLVVDKARSSLSPAAYTAAQTATLDIRADSVSLHLYLDGSVLEVIVDDQVALTTRLYPTRPDSTGLALVSQGRTLFRDLTVWRMRSIW